MTTIFIKPIPRHQTRGQMNRTEQAYDGYLAKLKLAGKIIEYRFEAVTLRLAQRTTYTPDFFVITENDFQFHEVKGFWRDDARVKFKVAAEQFPWFVFFEVTYKNKIWNIIKYN